MNHNVHAGDVSTKAAEEAASDVVMQEFMGGTVRLVQYRDGYRISMDTMMLAAAVPAKAGERVLEGGVGAGGASILLAHRVPGVYVHGIDMQHDMLALAKQNVSVNKLKGYITLEHNCITDLSGGEGIYDHVMVNPPYLAAGTAIRSPQATKGLARMDSNASLRDWMKFCVHKAKNRGTITIIYPADRMDEVISHMYRRVGDIKVMPLWPRAGVPAKRVIIQGRKGVHGASMILPGLVLHEEGRGNTEEAAAILRDGGALDLKAFASVK